MAEYIKRVTVINHLDACMDTIWKPEIVALKCFVEGIPAADVAPVQHGRWIEKTAPAVHKYYECSNLCKFWHKERDNRRRSSYRCGWFAHKRKRVHVQRASI